MSPTPIPSRVTIDFRDSVHPSRSWILGVDEGAPQRVELISFDTLDEVTAGRSMTAVGARPHPGAHLHLTVLVPECACPEFCELDHANE